MSSHRQGPGTGCPRCMMSDPSVGSDIVSLIGPLESFPPAACLKILAAIDDQRLDPLFY